MSDWPVASLRNEPSDASEYAAVSLSDGDDIGEGRSNVDP